MHGSTWVWNVDSHFSGESSSLTFPMKNQLLPMKKSIPHEKWPLGRFPATNARGLRCGSINLSIGFLGAQLERLIPQMEAEPFKSLDNNLIIGCSFSLGKKNKRTGDIWWWSFGTWKYLKGCAVLMFPPRTPLMLDPMVRGIIPKWPRYAALENSLVSSFMHLDTHTHNHIYIIIYI